MLAAWHSGKSSCHPPSWGRYRQVQATAAASSPRYLTDSQAPALCLHPSCLPPAKSLCWSLEYMQCPVLFLPQHSPQLIRSALSSILPSTSPNTSHQSSSIPVHLSGECTGFRPWIDTPVPTPIQVTRLSLSSGSSVTFWLPR